MQVVGNIAPVPALQGASDLGIGKETDRGHDSPRESRAVRTRIARSQKNTIYHSWGIKKGSPEEETSELGRTEEEERRKAFQAVSLECTVTQRQGTDQYVQQLLEGERQVGEGAGEAGNDQFLEAWRPRLRGSGWVLWKSSPERNVGIWVSRSSL